MYVSIWFAVLLQALNGCLNIYDGIEVSVCRFCIIAHVDCLDDSLIIAIHTMQPPLRRTQVCGIYLRS